MNIAQPYWSLGLKCASRGDPLHPHEKALALKKQLSLSDQAYFDETMATYLLGTSVSANLSPHTNKNEALS